MYVLICVSFFILVCLYVCINPGPLEMMNDSDESDNGLFNQGLGCETKCDQASRGEFLVDKLHHAGGGLWHDAECRVLSVWRGGEPPFTEAPKSVSALNITGVDTLAKGEYFWPQECIYKPCDPPRFRVRVALESMYGDEWDAKVDPRGLMGAAIERVHSLVYMAATINTNARSSDEDYPVDMYSRHMEEAMRDCHACEPWDHLAVFRCCDLAIPQRHGTLPFGDSLMLGVPDINEADDEEYLRMLSFVLCQNECPYRFNCPRHEYDEGPKAHEEWYSLSMLVRHMQSHRRDEYSLVCEYMGRDILGCLVGPTFAFTCPVHPSALDKQDRVGFCGGDRVDRAERLSNMRSRLTVFCVGHVHRSRALGAVVKIVTTVVQADVQHMTQQLSPEIQQGNHRLFRYMQRDHFARRYAWARFARMVNSPRAFAREQVLRLDSRTLFTTDPATAFGERLVSVGVDAFLAYMDSDYSYMQKPKEPDALHLCYKWSRHERSRGVFNFFGVRLIADLCVKPPPINPAYCSVDCRGSGFSAATESFIRRLWRRRGPWKREDFLVPSSAWRLVSKSRSARDRFALEPENEDTEPDNFRTDSD